MLEPARLLYRLMSASEKKYLVLLACMLTLMGFLQVLGVASIMPFLALVGDPNIIDTNRWLSLAYSTLGFQEKSSFVVMSGFFSLVMLLVSNGFGFLVTWALLKYAHVFNYTLSLRMFKLYMMQPYSFFLAHNSSEMGKNILDEVGGITVNVMYKFLIVASRIVIVLSILVFMLVLKPLASLGLFVCFGGCYVLAYTLTRNTMAVVGKKRSAAMSGRFAVAGDAFRSVKEVKSANRERYFYDAFSEHAHVFSRQCTITEVIAAGPRHILEVVAFGSMITLVLVFYMRGQDMTDILPLMGMYALGGMKMMPALQQMYEAITSIRFYSPALEVLYDDFEKYKHAELPFDNGTNSLNFSEKIELRDVSFSYVDDSEYILKKLNLSIKRNEMIGVVGSTGAGKTTTIDILMGLLKASKGDLYVDDVVVDESNVAAWRQHIGYVPQFISLLDDTIRNNILFGADMADVDEERVVLAAKIANIHDHIINEMPDKYESNVGEQGVRLSGGQRQRIGIARALYHDPDVLILDEATSALDGETEKSVMESIKKLAGQKTIIMIAHRLTTLSACDRIIVLQKDMDAVSCSYDDLVQGKFNIAAQTEQAEASS